MGIRGGIERAVGVRVGRHVNGIALNPLEYLLGSDEGPKIFETEEKAKECLRKYGWTDEEMYWLVFEQVD